MPSSSRSETPEELVGDWFPARLKYSCSIFFTFHQPQLTSEVAIKATTTPRVTTFRPLHSRMSLMHGISGLKRMVNARLRQPPLHHQVLQHTQPKSDRLSAVHRHQCCYSSLQSDVPSIPFHTFYHTISNKDSFRSWVVMTNLSCQLALDCKNSFLPHWRIMCHLGSRLAPLLHRISAAPCRVPSESWITRPTGCGKLLHYTPFPIIIRRLPPKVWDIR